MASPAGMTLRNRSLPATTLPGRQINDGDNQAGSAARIPADDGEPQVDPGDSVSQVQSCNSKRSSVSAKSSQISVLRVQAIAKKAQLLARNESLKAMQSIELAEIKLKQKREQLELNLMISEIDAEQGAYADNERESIREHFGATADLTHAPAVTNSSTINDINRQRLLS